MRRKKAAVLPFIMVLLAVLLFAVLLWLLWEFVPRAAVRYGLLGALGGICVLTGWWAWYQRRQVTLFADDLCETLDALMSGRQPEGYRPYEDSLTAKVQGKLLQYFDIMNEGKVQS